MYCNNIVWDELQCTARALKQMCGEIENQEIRNTYDRKGHPATRPGKNQLRLT